MSTIPTIKKIEELLSISLVEAPKRGDDPLAGLMPYKRATPKYALENGVLIGLNLADTGLTDEIWKQVTQLDGFQPISIRALNLSDNQLNEFRLNGMRNLQSLNLDTNPLESIPEEIVRQGNEALLHYLQALEQQGERDVYEIKMLILGEGGAGKTTLWNKLQNPSYPVPNYNQQSTVGINIKEGWSFPHIDNPDTEFLVNLWDFGGQEIQLFTHQFFLTKRSFYVLLSDGKHGEANFSYWFKIIHLLGSAPETQTQPIPVLVILNKRGRTNPVLPYDPEDTRKSFPHMEIINYDANFAKEDYQILRLTSTIQEILCKKIEHLPIKLPRLWDIVRMELIELRKERDYIKLDHFVEICRRNGIEDSSQLTFLSQTFHELGVFLHYHNDIRLRNILVLRPQWVVNGVYEILKHEKVSKNQGRFDENFLTQVWDAKDYAPEEQVFLLGLMQKDSFEVCFKAEEDGRQVYIAPQLLPDFAPSFSWEKNQQTLRYNYQYSFMPKGLIGRLIVRLNELLKIDEGKKIVWKRGMLLADHESEALIVETLVPQTGGKAFRIEIKGPNLEDRRYFLRIIRSELEKIHRRSFPSLKFNELIPCFCSYCSSNDSPHFFELELLQRAKSKGRKTLECPLSFDDISIQALLGEVEIEQNKILSNEGKVYSSVEELVSNDKLEEALNLLRDYANAQGKPQLASNVIIVNSQMRGLELDRRQRLIDPAHYRIEIHKVRRTILQLITPEGVSKQIEIKNRVKEYEEFLRKNPEDLDTWAHLADTYRELGRDEDSKLALDRYEEIKGKKDFEVNLENPISLKELGISGIRFFQPMNWHLTPQINILLGKNGFGKSYLMRLLVATLLKADKRIDDYFKKCKPDAKIELAIQQNSMSKLVIRGLTSFIEDCGKIPILAIPDSRFLNRSITHISPPTEEHGDLRTDSAYHFLYQSPYESIIQIFLYQLCIDYLENGKTFEQPIFQLVKNVINTLTDSEFDFHEIKSLTGAKFEILVRTDGNSETPIPIQHASQGTLSVLSMFGLIYYYLRSIYPKEVVDENLFEQKAIVLIDEIDAHLHPSWQQKIVSLLRGIYPNIQFIISAHSPLVVAGCLSGEVSVMRKTRKEDGFWVQQYEGDFIGATASELYETIFEIEEGLDDQLNFDLVFREGLEEKIDHLETIEETEGLTFEQQIMLDKLYDEMHHLNQFVKARKKREQRQNQLQELERLRLENEALRIELKNYASSQMPQSEDKPKKS